jgi:hypothetical protein
MTAKNIFGRQSPAIAMVDLGIANIGAGNEITVTIPPGGVLADLKFLTTTAFDGTTNTATVSDGTTTFVNAVDVKSTGSETVANVPKFYPSGGTLTFSMAQTGTATVGRALAWAAILGVNRVTEGP